MTAIQLDQSVRRVWFRVEDGRSQETNYGSIDFYGIFRYCFFVFWVKFVRSSYGIVLAMVITVFLIPRSFLLCKI